MTAESGGASWIQYLYIRLTQLHLVDCTLLSSCLLHTHLSNTPYKGERFSTEVFILVVKGLVSLIQGFLFRMWFCPLAHTPAPCWIGTGVLT